MAALLAFAGSFQARTSIDQIEVSPSERLRWVVRLFVQPRLIVFVALGVPLIFFTQQLPLLAPVVNIIAIPVIGLLILPIFFASLFVSLVHELLAILLMDVANGTIFIAY